jgi:hypothetical protein
VPGLRGRRVRRGERAPLEHTDAAYQAATWEAAHLVILASIPLLVLGLPAVHRMLRGRVSDR